VLDESHLTMTIFFFNLNNHIYNCTVIKSFQTNNKKKSVYIGKNDLASLYTKKFNSTLIIVKDTYLCVTGQYENCQKIKYEKIYTTDIYNRVPILISTLENSNIANTLSFASLGNTRNHSFFSVFS